VTENDLHDETLPLGFTFSFPCRQEGLAKVNIYFLNGFQKGFLSKKNSSNFFFQIFLSKKKFHNIIFYKILFFLNHVKFSKALTAKSEKPKVILLFVKTNKNPAALLIVTAPIVNSIVKTNKNLIVNSMISLNSV
jgi:hypothetical protein